MYGGITHSARMATDRKKLGLLAEKRAQEFVQQHGFAIVVHNFRCRTGELDIVAARDRLLVIFEVRLRSSNAFGGAAASVTPIKRARIRRATRYFLVRHPGLATRTVRFDALLFERVDGPIEWIQNAFS
jgi:putative endonuclease